MSDRFERANAEIRAVVREMRREDITFMAASIAYHAIVSILPILLLVTLIVSLFGSGRFVATVLRLTKVFLPETSQQIIAVALRNATQNIGLSVVSIVALLWGDV